VNAKKMIIAAVAALMLLIGAGAAYASGSGDDSSGQATGPGMDKAKSVALDHVNGRVTGTEAGAYEVEVTKDEGTQVDVHLDKNYNVLGTPADNEGPDGQDAANDSGA
jgi:uncharacterized membrane protein YkoI